MVEEKKEEEVQEETKEEAVLTARVESKEKTSSVDSADSPQVEPGTDEEKKEEAVSSEEAEEKPKKAVKKAKGRKKKIQQRPVPTGRAYIQATYNNTIITITDQIGNAISWSAAGLNGFKGPKKATPYAAGIITREAVSRAKERGLKEVHVLVKGVGTGREAAIRALNANGINILSIKDVTPIPHNGCRSKKPRRV